MEVCVEHDKHFCLLRLTTLTGHVFAGATLPFGDSYHTSCSHLSRLTNTGMAKAVADTKGENQAGFAYDTKVVTGFSHMHDSGTGGVSFRRTLEICLVSDWLRSPHQWEISPSSRKEIARKTILNSANGNNQIEQLPGIESRPKLAQGISAFHWRMAFTRK